MLMKMLMEVKGDITVTQMIEALEKVDNKSAFVGVWWEYNGQAPSIKGIEYAKDDPQDCRSVWINVEDRGE